MLVVCSDHGSIVHGANGNIIDRKPDVRAALPAVMDVAADVQVVDVADGVLVLATLGTTDQMCVQCWHTAAALDGDGIWVCLFGLRLGFLL